MKQWWETSITEHIEAQKHKNALAAKSHWGIIVNCNGKRVSYGAEYELMKVHCCTVGQNHSFCSWITRHVFRRNLQTKSLTVQEQSANQLLQMFFILGPLKN
jgi:hypothetical protein